MACVVGGRNFDLLARDLMCAIGHVEDVACGDLAVLLNLNTPEDYASAEVCRPKRVTIMFSERLLDYFEHPRNAGELPGSHARVQIENPICGDVLELSVLVIEERIHRARFLAKGCVPLMACSSILAEMVEGLTVAEAARIDKAKFLVNSGPLPQASGHAAEMAVDAVRGIVKRLRARSTA